MSKIRSNYFILKYILLLVNIFVFLTFFLNSVSAKDACDIISDLDQKLACYDKEKASLTKSRDSFNKQLEDILSQKNQVNSQINNLSSQLTNTNSQINSIDATLKKISSEIELIEKNLNERRDSLNQKFSLRDSVLKSYYYAKTTNDVENIFGTESNSFSQISVGLITISAPIAA